MKFLFVVVFFVISISYAKCAEHRLTYGFNPDVYSVKSLFKIDQLMNLKDQWDLSLEIKKISFFFKSSLKAKPLHAIRLTVNGQQIEAKLVKSKNQQAFLHFNSFVIGPEDKITLKTIGGNRVVKMEILINTLELSEPKF